jgi:hypothetical protein
MDLDARFTRLDERDAHWPVQPVRDYLARRWPFLGRESTLQLGRVSDGVQPVAHEIVGWPGIAGRQRWNRAIARGYFTDREAESVAMELCGGSPIVFWPDWYDSHNEEEPYEANCD